MHETQVGQPVQKKHKTHSTLIGNPTPSSSKLHDARKNPIQGTSRSTDKEHQQKPKQKNPNGNGLAFARKKNDQSSYHPFTSSFETIVKEIIRDLPLSASWKHFIDRVLPLVLNHIPSLLSSFM